MTGGPPKGRLIAVVGPSGVGKDSVIAGLCAAEPRLTPVRRVITRAPEPGGEDHIAVTEPQFAEMRAQGAFCLHWGAHGLFYGIPAAVPQQVEAGAQLLVNLSRGVLAQALALCPALLVLHVTARPETLARRLAQRGRESTEDMERRLDRAAQPLLPQDLPGLVIHSLSNDGPLPDTVAQARRLLQPERA